MKLHLMLIGVIMLSSRREFFVQCLPTMQIIKPMSKKAELVFNKLVSKKAEFVFRERIVIHFHLMDSNKTQIFF